MSKLSEIIALAKKNLLGEGYPEDIAERVVQSIDDDTLFKVANRDISLDEASRFARAREMGVNMDQPMYHTGNDLINRVQPRNYPYTDTQAPFWLADRKDVSATYASGADPQEFFLKGNMASMDAGGSAWNQLRDKPLLDSSGAQVIPKERPSGYRTTDDFVDVVRNQTNDEGLLFNNILDLGGNYTNARRVITETDPKANIPDIFKHLESQGHGVAAVLNPNNVRSKWALFDKPDTNSVFGSRMAPTAAAGLLGAAALTQSEDTEAGKFSIDDLRYLYKQAKDGNEGALKWLMDDSGLDAADTLRRVENKIAKADRVTPTGDLTPTPEPDFSYRGSHRAPDADYGAPLHNLTEMIPEDIYGPKGQQYYGYGDPAVDREVFDAVRKARGNPDLEIPIYRAVPEGVDKINAGDWVTTSKEYARQHGENALGGKYSILEDVAPAKKLQSEGYPYEFGLLPALSAMAIGLGTSNEADAAALEAGMPMAMQAGGQSAMDAKPDLGRDTGTILGLMDFLLPLVGEAFKPATMGNAELTDEQRRMRKYYGQ